MNEHKETVCGASGEVVPPIKSAWEQKLAQGYTDECVGQFAVWGRYVVCLLRTSVSILDPLDGSIIEESDILPGGKEQLPMEVKDFVIGEEGKAYAWARYRENEISECCTGEPWQTKDEDLRMGYPTSEWAVIEFEIKTGIILNEFYVPGTGNDFQSTFNIGRQGRFLKSDDGQYFDWRVGQWLREIPEGEVQLNQQWRSKEGYLFERMRTGWYCISREGDLNRFVKLPCETFGIYEGADILVGGLSQRRIIAWRCHDLVINGVFEPSMDELTTTIADALEAKWGVERMEQTSMPKSESIVDVKDARWIIVSWAECLSSNNQINKAFEHMAESFNLPPESIKKSQNEKREWVMANQCKLTDADALKVANFMINDN